MVKIFVEKNCLLSTLMFFAFAYRACEAKSHGADGLRSDNFLFTSSPAFNGR
jgi:hypothetical protein